MPRQAESFGDLGLLKTLVSFSIALQLQSSRSYSEYSRSDEFSTLETPGQLTRCPPVEHHSSERNLRSEEERSVTETRTSSTPLETARSPPARSSSIMSFASLPNILSHYETAIVCSSKSEVTKSVPVHPLYPVQSGPSPNRSTSPLPSVTESIPSTLTPSSHPASPRAPSSPESL